MMKLMTAALLGAALGTAAVAQTTTQSSNPAQKSADPNRRICERTEETGSRLGGRTVCKTAREWEEQRREHRNELERAQKNVGISNPG